MVFVYVIILIINDVFVEDLILDVVKEMLIILKLSYNVGKYVKVSGFFFIFVV